MIVVFGSNVLDLFFQQENLPPKDTALFLDSHVEAPGGKGANQAIAASRAGSNVRFYGALGDGGHGRQMYKNLANNGIDVSGIKFLENVPSGLATIFVDEADGTHRIVVSQGANLLAKQDTVPDKHLGEDTILLVQGELPIQETEKLIIRAKSKGAKTVMNFAPATQKLSEELLDSLDIIVMNQYEAMSLGKQFGIESDNEEELAKLIQSRFNLMTIITMGGNGSLAVTEDKTYKIPALGIKPVDTVGAGDAHVGYLCAALDQKLPIEEAFKWASVAGSLACTMIGAQSALPSKDRVMEELARTKMALTIS